MPQVQTQARSAWTCAECAGRACVLFLVSHTWLPVFPSQSRAGSRVSLCCAGSLASPGHSRWLLVLWSRLALWGSDCTSCSLISKFQSMPFSPVAWIMHRVLHSVQPPHHRLLGEKSLFPWCLTSLLPDKYLPLGGLSPVRSTECHKCKGVPCCSVVSAFFLPVWSLFTPRD